MAAASPYGNIDGRPTPQIVFGVSSVTNLMHRMDTRQFNQGRARLACAPAFISKTGDAGNGLGR